MRGHQPKPRGRPDPRRARRPRFAAALLAAAIVAACDALGLGEDGKGLTPAGAVEDYLDASAAGDCRAASRLATPDVVRQGLWCENPRVLSFGEISSDEPTPDDAEVVFVVDAVVLGGTGLEVMGLRAGENKVVVVVVRQPDGTWRVSQATGRD